MARRLFMIRLNRLIADFDGARTPFVVLILTAVSVTLVEYLFIPVRFGLFFSGPVHVLAPYAWWIFGTILLWVLLPLGVARWLGFAWRDVGLSAKGLLSKVPLYLALYIVAMIGVVWASSQPSFLEAYPFLRAEQTPSWSWRLLLGFWGLYALQFFCVEFFFRGYLLFTLEKHFGIGAIAVMAVPYCMIHFHKPMPEALAAIFGAVVLGWLAIRTRSIWGGVFLHIAIALSMDSLAMMQNQTGFPTTWM